MKLFLLFIALFAFFQTTSAVELKVRCAKWDEGHPQKFVCSNKKTYAVGMAICTTEDPKRKTKDLPAPTPTDIFCTWNNSPDVSKCLNDESKETTKCYIEQKSAESNAAPGTEKRAVK